MPSVESLISQFQAQDSKKQALATSAVQSYDTNPDQQVENLKLAREAGIPAATMPEATDDAKMRVLINRMQQTADTAPATADFLTNPDNAKIAHDDVHNLSGMEQVFAPFAGFAAKMMAGLASNEIVGTKAMNIISRGRQLLNEHGNGQFQQDLQGATDEATANVAANVKYWDDIAAKYGEDDTLGGRIVGGLAKGIAGLPAGIVGFNPAFGAASAAAETSGVPGSNGLDVIASGAAEAIKLKGLAKIFHAIEGTGLGQTGKMALTGGAMGFQTGAEIAGSQGLGALTSTKGLEEVATSLVTGAALGYSHVSGEQGVIRDRLVSQGIDAGEATKIAQAAPVIYPLAHDLAQANEAKQTQAFFSALGDSAESTKLLERMPEKMKEFIQGLKEDGPIDNVFVPADRWQEYWQKVGQDPDAVAGQVTGDPTQFREAMATGGDVVIPLEDFVSKLAGTEHYQGLTDDIKIRPGAMTAREAADFEKNLPQRLEELKGQINAQDAQNEATREPWQKVYDDVFAQLKEIYPRDTAEKYATLAAVRARTRADRLGMNALDLYNESPLNIVGQTDQGGGDSNGLQGQRDGQGGKGGLLTPAGGEGTPPLTQFDQSHKDAGFVSSPAGKVDFGQITPEIGAAIKRESAPIRLRQGDESEGLQHIDARHKSGYESMGYASAADFVHDIIKNTDAIYPADGGALDLVVTKGKLKFARVRLEPSEDGSYYDVKTATPGRAEQYKNKKPLWESTGTSTPSGENQTPFVPGAKTTSDTILDQAAKNVKRGFFRFTPDGGQREIGILEHADLSTFIHESGHSWLEELKQDAARPDAPEQLKEDWATIQKWLGADGNEITREQHEQFARGAEAVLMEGNAPSAELTPVFARFKLWLTQIYCSMKGLNINLTDGVRGVMDRLLATDDEIKRAQDQVGQRPLFATAEDAGMTPREFEAYQKDAGAAGARARDVLAGQLMKELSRERETWWKTEKDKTREEVLAEAKQDPVYTALQEVLKGKGWDGSETPLKMDRDELVKRYGEDFVKKLPKGSATEFLYAKEGGIDPDLLAERYGFSSGDEMIRKMMETPSLKRHLVTETDLRMKERHGDMQRDGSIADEALKAVHNDHWGEVLRAEIKALQRKAREVKPYVDAAKGDAAEQARKDTEGTARWNDAQEKFGKEIDAAKRADSAATIPPISAFREAAKQQIGGKRVAEISPQDYLSAERKAARKAFEANGAGDYRKAAEARFQQMLNHYLYFEAAKARELSDKIQKYATKMGQATTLGKLGLAGEVYLQQMKAILARYEFVKVPLAELQERKETLEKFLGRLRSEDNLDLPIDPSIVDEMQKPVNYRDLSMDELGSVYDALRMIEHAAKEVNKVTKDGLSVQADDAARSLIMRLQSSIPERGVSAVNDTSLSFLEKVKEHAGEIDLPVLRPEFIFERLDGGSRGVWHDFFWNRYNDAANFQNRLRETIFPTIQELANDKGIDRSKGKIEIKSLRGSLSKDDIIAIALNCGNEGNLDKLMRGGIRFQHADHAIPLTDEMLQEILGHLNPEEIKVVNGIWRSIEKLKPEAASLARRRVGIEPTWVEPVPMEIKNGTLEGGYYPLKGDPRYSKVGEKQSDSSTLDQMFTKFAPSNTRQGYMKERTSAAYVLSLDWQSIVGRHLDEVITDISHWDFATQAQKLLKRGDVKDALIDRLGMNGYKNLLDWVRYTVNQDSMGPEASDSIDKVRRAVRTKASTYILGFKVQNAIADALIGIPLACQRLEPTSVFRGSMEYLRNPKAAHAFAQASSEYMRHLDLEVDRDLTEALNQLGGKTSVTDDVRRWAIESRVWAFKIAATASWLSGYREAQSKGLDGLEASRFADKMPRMTQDAGRAGDRSAVERNPYMKELTMYIGPTLIQYNNNASAVRRIMDQGLNRGTVGNAAKTFFFGYLANSVIYQMLRGRTPDDKDKLPAWLACKLGLGMFEGIPIARDLAAYAEGKILNEPGKSMRNIPVMEAGKALVDAGASIGSATLGEGEPRKAAKDTANAIGAWTGLPALQGTITGEYLYDVLSGQYSPEHPWSPLTDIVNRRKKH